MPIQPDIVYQTECADLRWYAPDAVLEFKWKCFISGEELRAIFEEQLEQSARLGARRWLTDYTELSAMRLADQDWIVEDYSPRLATQLQLERSAIVRPAHPLGVWFLDSMVARLSHIRPWPVAGFPSRDAAYAWLVRPEESSPSPAKRLR